MKEEEKTICWLGTIPECDKDKVRYPTEEEMDKMMEELESVTEEEDRWDKSDEKKENRLLSGEEKEKLQGI